MNILIVYDSIFGNTAQVANAMRDELTALAHTVQIHPVSEAFPFAFHDTDLLIVGSPTRGFRPTPAISEFIEGIDTALVGGRPAAAFDTRMSLDDIHPAPLRWVVDAGGYAADRIAQMLGHRGFAAVGTHGGFLVGGTEGPMKPGEIERAKAWAADVVAQAAPPGTASSEVAQRKAS